MGVSAWVAGPIALVGIIALLSVLGLGSTELYNAGFDNATFGNIEMSSSLSGPEIYYDGGGHAVCYANLTCIGENGKLVTQNYMKGIVFWNNGTNINYPLWHDANKEKILQWDQVSQLNGLPTDNALGSFSASLGTGLGVIAVITGIVAVGVIASVKFFGFGLSDVGINTLMKGSAYILIYALFSGLSMNLIATSGDLFTPLIYLGSTGVFTLGVMGEIGTPSQGS